MTGAILLVTAFALFGVSESGDVLTFTSDTTVTIDENVPAGATLMTVVGATPAASPVTYFLSSQNPSGMYDVDSSSGVITVASGQSLDTESLSSHTVYIRGESESGSTVGLTITVTVADVNDNSPAIGLAATTFPAGATTGTIGTYAATDDDASSPNNDISEYSINCTSNAFAVSSSGEVSLVSGSTGPQDRCYALLIEAVDAGTNPGSLTGTGTVFITVGNATCTITYMDLCGNGNPVGDGGDGGGCGGAPTVTFPLFAMMLALLTFMLI